MPEQPMGTRFCGFEAMINDLILIIQINNKCHSFQWLRDCDRPDWHACDHDFLDQHPDCPTINYI